MSKNKIRRVNFLAGPGCGKSTAAHTLFGELRREGKSAHLVREWVKDWAIEGRKPIGFDQLAVIGNQILLEETALRAYPLVINESALWINMYYTQSIAPLYVKTIRAFDSVYPALNYFLFPIYVSETDFEQAGRFADFNDNIKTHNLMYQMIQEHNIPHRILNLSDPNWVKRVMKDIYE